MPLTQKERSRRYYEKKKELIKEKNRIYREENKEQLKDYRERNKEKIAEREKQYYQENKEAKKEYYKNSPKHYKTTTINNWKRIGVIDDDYDKLFEIYNNQTHCWICRKEFDKRNNRHLDHDHDTGRVRYICCRSCNAKLV